jgi:hypothetical protein
MEWMRIFLLVYGWGAAGHALLLLLGLALGWLQCEASGRARAKAVLAHAALWPFTLALLAGECIHFASQCLFDE